MNKYLKQKPGCEEKRPGLVFGYAVWKAPVLVLPWLPTETLRKIRDNHERGHAWGIESCPVRSCIMYEGGDNLKEKLISWPLILWRYITTGHWFCKTCREKLEGLGAFED